MSDDELPTVTLYHVTEDDEEMPLWHDGPGWYYVIDEYPDEGSCGAYETYSEACSAARSHGYAINAVL